MDIKEYSDKGKKVEYGSARLVGRDKRRDIMEVEFHECGASVQYFEILEDCTVGNHYHSGKSEVYNFTDKASGIAQIAKVDEKGNVTGVVEFIRVKPFTSIFIPPMHAHRFDLSAGTHIVVFSTNLFDPEDVILAQLLEPPDPF